MNQKERGRSSFYPRHDSKIKEWRNAEDLLTESAVGSNRRVIRFLRVTREILDGVEQIVLLFLVLDVGVDEEAVHLGVNVFDGNLKSVETPSFGDLKDGSF